MELKISLLGNLLPIASSVPIGNTGEVHIRGRNDMLTNQKLGIHIIVIDPDEVIIENYKDWEYGDTSPYATQHFKSPPFELYKEGTYTLDAKLLMNPSNPVTVASYEGVLCTVSVPGEPPEEPPEEEPTRIPWTPILLGIGAVGALMLLSDRKPRRKRRAQKSRLY